jgi:hypothetical protein
MDSADEKIRLKSWRLILSSLIFVTTCLSCWTAEDSIKVIDDLTADFKIIVDENGEDAEFILAQHYDETFFQTIEDRCKLVYFDSARIYVKSNWNPSSKNAFHFLEIIIKPTGTNDPGGSSFSKRELTQAEFEKLVNACATCQLKDYTTVPKNN